MDPNTDSALGDSHDPLSNRRPDVLQTKLFLPGTPPGFVSRPRLADRLDDGLAQKVTLVSAPAGFGKTSQVAAWCREHDTPAAWLSLDSGDNDPVRFWRHTAAALDRIVPGVSASVEPMLELSHTAAMEDTVTVTINALAAESTPKMLVLDDYHEIETSEVHSSLGFLIEHAPPEFHLVILTRSDPPLPLSRLRGRGQLSEVRAEHLRFQKEEAAALLQETLAVELQDSEIATLTDRTEGWAVGLHLAGLALQSQSDVAGFVARFSGSHRFVLDYLTEEVLEGQSEHVREFLLETSLLERLSGPLCDALTQRTDGQQILEALEAANLFLIPLDGVRGWWRYHSPVQGPPAAEARVPTTGTRTRVAPQRRPLARRARGRRQLGPPCSGCRRSRVGRPADRAPLRRLVSGQRGGHSAAVARCIAGQPGP